MSEHSLPPEAARLIAELGLAPHPEGGYFRETFRDPHTTPDGRAACTLIYFLLVAGQVSRWHTVDASEIWLWHAGAALELGIAPPGGAAARVVLGFEAGARQWPQAIVPAGHWQQARSLGAWTLVSCAVAPGFMFDGFRMAPPHAEPPFAL